RSDTKRVAYVLMRHSTPAEDTRDLDPVAFLEKSLRRSHLPMIIVIVDHWSELDLLDLDHLLFLAGFRGLLLRLVFIFAVIENLADRRGRIGGDLDEIEAGFPGLVQCDLELHGTKIVAGLIDQLDFANPDLL